MMSALVSSPTRWSPSRTGFLAHPLGRTELCDALWPCFLPTLIVLLRITVASLFYKLAFQRQACVFPIGNTSGISRYVLVSRAFQNHVRVLAGWASIV